MKKLALLFTFSMIFLSCEKTLPDVPEKEIPDWLKTKISHDEQLIVASPKAGSAWGAWIRYKWEKTYYFEYSNITSSSLYIPISVSGDSLYANIYDTNADYYKNKCCKQFVWKGPLFKDY